MWKPGTDKPGSSSSSNRKSAPSKQSIAAAGPNKPAATNAAAAATAPPKGSEPRPTSKSALSQKTLAMKFMQRKQQADARKQTAAHERKQQSEWTTAQSTDTDADNVIVCEQDVADPSLPLIFGRRSFNGFNKNIEDEYREAARQQRFAASEANELRDEISAHEMVARMIKYTGLVRGGPGGGKSRNAPRPPKRQKK